LQRCQPGDRAVVFGSFYTVSEALGLLAQQRDV
jgi:folylpolyglutamate synthase/dihydropteroate synthase